MLVHLGIVVMSCVVRAPLLMRGYGVVLVNRIGMDGAGSFMTRASANAAYVGDSDAHEPQERARPREDAEQGADFRLPRSFHLQSLANLALCHILRFCSLLASG